MAIKNGSLPDADEVINAFGIIFKNMSQNLFNAKYIGFNANLNVATGAPNLKNCVYDVMDSDSADTNTGFSYDSSNDYYYTPDLTECIVIEATSYDDTWSNGDNDVYVQEITTGKWLVFCDTGTTTVHRAQIHKSLWYGTDGTDKLISDFASVTAVKTTNASDVGKRGSYVNAAMTSTGQAGTYTGTFADTSTNTGCSSWSIVYVNTGSATYCRWEFPSGTVLNTRTGAGTTDEFGIDTSGDDADNPADCQCDGSFAGDNIGYVRSIILHSGAISWVNSGWETISNVDSYDDLSIPIFTATADADIEVSTLIFKDTASETVTNAIMTMNYSIDGTNSAQLSFSADGTNWTNATDAEIVRPTNTGTSIWRRIQITRADFTASDKVSEEACVYNLY